MIWLLNLLRKKKEKIKPKFDFKEEQIRIEKEKQSLAQHFNVMETVNQFDFSSDEEKKR